MPFEALVKNDIVKENDYTKFDFLINHHNIDYQYSLGMLSLMKNKKSIKGQYHLYVPEFTINNNLLNERNIKLSPLPFAKEEIEDIHKIITSKVYNGGEANESNFVKSLAKASILHFAGHAIIDEEDHNLSYLAFSAKDGEEDKLYLRELVGSNSNADMIVLSACQTGFGKYGEGEGLLSLGRSLVACGTKSIVTSLWNVNDLTGKPIMTEFYKNLIAGQTKSEALRNSKLKYLANADSKSHMHPYHWSAFIFIGDESHIELKQNNLILYSSLLLAPILVLLSIIIFKRIKK
jgi:CHAT domain-containing protein